MNESSKDPRTGVSVDGFFSANYSEISRWAMEITSFDKSISEDLIHDAYLKLLRTRQDLSTVDPNAYVYVSMRNTYRSQFRSRQTSNPDVRIVDEIVEREFYQDPRWSHKISDSLVEICEFACSKRRSTISASLLLLRYFLGYSPEELSKVTNRSTGAIDTRLATIRREISFLSVGSLGRDQLAGMSGAWVDTGLFEKLRERIFRSPEGRCLPAHQLRRAYRWKSGRPDREELSHLVSCRKCLEMANQLLKIEALRQRSPLDALTKERFFGSVFGTAMSIASQLGYCLWIS